MCQLSYLLENVSLGHVGPLNERLSTDFNGFVGKRWGEREIPTLFVSL